jgi:hypothetical protein
MLPPLKDIDDATFRKNFATEEMCLKFLAEKKWGEGFKCKKCGNKNYCQGKTPYSRRCTKCKHQESAKVNTIFHGCRFSLPEAFYIAYTVCFSKNISTRKLSEQTEIRQMTCWKFKKKITECFSRMKGTNKKTGNMFQKIILEE